MKPPLARYLITALFCGLAGTTFADDFRSEVIMGTVPLGPIRVHGDQFMVIRNFTQEMGTTRGVVTVSKPPNPPVPVSVLAAAIISQSTSPPLDVINSVVIAGPADVTFTCGTSATCFVSFKKDSN
jgi:hypothetical protein